MLIFLKKATIDVKNRLQSKITNVLSLNKSFEVSTSLTVDYEQNGNYETDYSFVNYRFDKENKQTLHQSLINKQVVSTISNIKGSKYETYTQKATSDNVITYEKNLENTTDGYLETMIKVFANFGITLNDQVQTIDDLLLAIYGTKDLSDFSLNQNNYDDYCDINFSKFNSDYRLSIGLSHKGRLQLELRTDNNKPDASGIINNKRINIALSLGKDSIAFEGFDDIIANA